MVMVMMYNAINNNISVILWRSVLLVGETGAPGENYRPAAPHRQTLSHNVISSTHRHERDSTLVGCKLLFAYIDINPNSI